MKKEEILKAIEEPLLKWYDSNKRNLPWREDRNAYHVWISEIMLQQTRVNAVIPYYEKFMKELPTVHDLAAINEEKLLRLWQGLGYYSRARNLKKAAEAIEEYWNGIIPETYEEIIKLPGIGDYTAGAILSIAYQKAIPAVDGNALRVMARILCYDKNILVEKNKNEIHDLLQTVITKERPGDYNQAIMDLGAMVCLPNAQPLCEVCPLKNLCLASKYGKQVLLPVREKQKEKEIEKKTVFLLIRDGKIAIEKRNNSGILAGLWQYPNVDGELNEKEAATILENWGIKPHEWCKKVFRKHVFTHKIWEMTAYVVQIRKSAEQQFVWCSKEEYEDKAIPKAFNQFNGDFESYL